MIKRTYKESQRKQKYKLRNYGVILQDSSFYVITYKNTPDYGSSMGRPDKVGLFILICTYDL